MEFKTVEELLAFIADLDGYGLVETDPVLLAATLRDRWTGEQADA